MLLSTFIHALNWAGGAKSKPKQSDCSWHAIVDIPFSSLRRYLGRRCILSWQCHNYLNKSPFDTANEYDPETGASLRLTYGSLFGQNQTGMIYDEVHGSVIVPEYSMRYLIPLSQG